MSNTVSTEQALRELIEEDIKNGALPRGPGGRIERKRYADLLGVTKSAMSWHKHVFEEIEKRIGTGSRVENLVPAVKALFQRLLANGELEATDRGVGRKQLLEPFGLGNGGLPRRYKELRGLLAWCDAEVKRLAYLPPATRQMIEKCRAALATGEYDDLKTGSVRNRALRGALGFPGDAAYPDYLKEIVSAHQSALRCRLESDPLVCFVNEAPYSLRVFVEQGWNEEILLDIITYIKREFSERRGSYFQDTFNALNFLLSTLLITTDWSCREIFRSMNERVTVDSVHLRATFTKFLESQIGRTSHSPHTINHLIDATNRVLSLFARKGLLSGVRLKRNKTPHGKPRPTTLEIRAHRKSDKASEDAEKASLQTLIDFAKEKLQMSNSDVVANIGKDGAEAFLQTLRDESADLPTDLLSDPVKAMLHIVELRDGILRSEFSSLVKKWRAHLIRGQELLGQGLNPGDYWNDDFQSGKGLVRVEDVFPKNISKREFATANLLKLVREKFGGFIPGFSHANPKERRFFERLCRTFGGRGFLMAYLFPHDDLVGSLISLYLMDSGANVAVGISLNPSCIHDCNEAGFRMVLGNKEKAKGKPIVVYLSEDGEALRGMLDWQEDLPVFQHLGIEVLDDFFFALEKGGRIQPVNPDWFSTWFKSKTQQLDHFAKRDLYVVPSSLRPTVIMKAVLDESGSIRHAITLAQNLLSNSPSYFARFPMLLQFEVDQRNCQKILETICLHDLPDGPSYIGVTNADFESRLEEFEPTGFGLTCGNPFGHPRRPGQLCESFDCWDCGNGIMIAEPDDVSTLIQWRNALDADEAEWIRDHPERWNEYFVGWQAYIDFVEELMNQQPHLVDIWTEGNALAQAAMAATDYQPYRAWH